MAEYTDNYNLKKPSDEDFYNIDDFNGNAEIIDAELKSQSDRITKTEKPAFEESESEDNIESGETLPSLFSKIKKAISNLKEHIQASNPHSGSASIEHKHSATDIASGTLPVSRGGTGATTAAQALKNLGVNVTAEVINFLSGITSNIQTQLDGKASVTHTHTPADIGAAESAHGHMASEIDLDRLSKMQFEDDEGQSYYIGITPKEILLRKTSTSLPLTTVYTSIYPDHSYFPKAQIKDLTFDNIAEGVVTVEHGGTGATTAEDALVNLGINVTAEIINYLSGLTGNVQQQISSKASATHTHTLANLGAAASSHGHSADDITSGILPVSRGGTGATTATNARTALGIERDTGSVTFDSSKVFGENDTGNGYATIDFPTAYKKGTLPTVVATLIRNGNPIKNALTIVSRTNENFTVKYQHEGSGSITASFQWIAIGTPA